MASTRIVIVTRKTPLELLLARWGTLGQAKFYLGTRGQSIDPYHETHDRIQKGLQQTLGGLPADQKWTRIDRDGLDRFLFSPDDVVVIVGQDGLVPNVAKYLSGQLACGINPDPSRYDGVLCRLGPEAMPAVLQFALRGTGSLQIEERTMAEARREDGQTLLALNEIFVGHATHQSARYQLKLGGQTENQSSSGLIVTTGTGATGWARSIMQQRGIDQAPPGPADRSLLWMVREPFPSVSTGTTMNFGALKKGEVFEVTSHMGEGGTIFADGMESDRIEFSDGQTVQIRVAERALRLIVPPSQPAKPQPTKPQATRTEAAASPKPAKK